MTTTVVCPDWMPPSAISSSETKSGEGGRPASVHLDRHVVLGDRFLLLDRRRIDAQVDAALPLDQRNDPVKARPLGAMIAAEPEHDAAHILIGDADAGQSENDQHNDMIYDMVHSVLRAHHTAG